MGKVTIEQLPERLRALVQERLLELDNTMTIPQKDGEYMQTMYDGINGSPKKKIANTISANVTTIPLDSTSDLPDAPNLATIGNSSDAEVVLYATKSSTELIGCTRGFGGTTARSWPANTSVYRAFTKYDYDALKSNINEIAIANTGNQDVSGAISTHNSDTDAHQSIQSDIRTVDAALQSAFSKSNADVHSNKTEIDSVQYSVYKVVNGVLDKQANPPGYWKTIFAPVNCLYIDGVAKLKSGGLDGAEAHAIPSMAFVDENWNVLSAVYTTITAPNTFLFSDVPSGAVYAVFHYSEAFKFDFQSTDTMAKNAQADVDLISEELIQAGKYNIPLVFASATGYYNKDKVFTTYSGVTVAVVPANAGDVFCLTSRNYYDAARAVYMDSSDAIIDVLFTGNNGSEQSNTRFVAPANTVKILIQTFYNYACTLQKASVAERIDNIDSQVLAIGNATTEPGGTEVILSFESAAGYYNKNKGLDTYGGVTTAKVTVSEGQKYLLTTHNYYNAAIACLLDSEDAVKSVIWNANNVAEVKRQEIPIPAGISKLMIQRIYAYQPTILELFTGIENKPVKSLLQGKKITVIGDSITEKNFRAKINWALWLKYWGDPVIQNLGASGTGFYAGVSNENNYINRLSSVQANPDIIGVAFSFNDIAGSFPLGTATDAGTESVAGYANDFLAALITAYPTTPIIAYIQSPWSGLHPGNQRSDDWVSIAKQICALKGIPFYSDLYYGCTLKPWITATRATYYTSDDPDAGSIGTVDDTHPNSEGHKVIARYLYPRFTENLVTTGLDYFD